MTDDVTLHSASASITAVETAGHFTTRSNVVLGDTFVKPENIAQFGKQSRSSDIQVYRLRNVVLDGSRALLFKDGNRISDTRYLLLDHEYDEARVDADNTVAVRDSRDVVVGFNRVHHNFYHWLIQCLPAMYWSARGGDRATRVLALPDLAQWQEDALTLLGLADWDRVNVKPGVNYACDNVIYCDFLRGISAFVICQSLREPFAAMKQNASIRRTGMKHLYISRIDTKNRAIANEAEVADFMRSRGFTVIVPGQLTMNEQISVFHDAEIIVGGHGAGLSNVVFSQPRRMLLELLQSDYMNLSFNRLCQVAGVDYRAEVFDCSQQDDGPERNWEYIHRREWHLDLDLLHTAIEKIAPLTRVGPLNGDTVTGEDETIAAHDAALLEATAVVVHAKNVGDIRGGLGGWVGNPGSGRWIEGFSITPSEDIAPEEFEYLAVFDRTWSSPWTTSGQFCGCRGASLPLFGFSLRLSGAAALAYVCEYSATFLDGSMAGPMSEGSLCQAAGTLAPLEAIRVTLRRR
jgi:capsular polysaccharide biosynthesis protein